MGFSFLRHTLFFRRLWISIALLTVALPPIYGSIGWQDGSQIAATDVRNMNDSEARKFLLESLDLGLPESRMDQLAILAINRSQIIAPELSSRLEAALRDPNRSDRFVHTMADLLAYCGDELALDSVMRLTVMDHDRFGYFIGRILDYAHGRHNPYSLVYHGLGKAGPEVDTLLVSWVRENAPIGNGYRLWASAIAGRNNTAEFEISLKNDPLLARFSREGVADAHKRLTEAAKKLVNK